MLYKLVAVMLLGLLCDVSPQACLAEDKAPSASEGEQSKRTWREYWDYAEMPIDRRFAIHTTGFTIWVVDFPIAYSILGSQIKVAGKTTNSITSCRTNDFRSSNQYKKPGLQLTSIRGKGIKLKFAVEGHGTTLRVNRKHKFSLESEPPLILVNARGDVAQKPWSHYPRARLVRQQWEKTLERDKP